MAETYAETQLRLQQDVDIPVKSIQEYYDATEGLNLGTNVTLSAWKDKMKKEYKALYGIEANDQRLAMYLYKKYSLRVPFLNGKTKADWFDGQFYPLLNVYTHMPQNAEKLDALLSSDPTNTKIRIYLWAYKYPQLKLAGNGVGWEKLASEEIRWSILKKLDIDEEKKLAEEEKKTAIETPSTDSSSTPNMGSSMIPPVVEKTVWYKNKWVWIGGGTGLLAIGVTIFFVLKGKKAKK